MRGPGWCVIVRVLGAGLRTWQQGAWAWSLGRHVSDTLHPHVSAQPCALSLLSASCAVGAYLFFAVAAPCSPLTCRALLPPAATSRLAAPPNPHPPPQHPPPPPPPPTQPRSLGRTSNEAFCTAISKWAFQEQGVLRASQLSHRVVAGAHPGAVRPERYRINDDVEFSVVIQECVDGACQPYRRAAGLATRTTRAPLAVPLLLPAPQLGSARPACCCPAPACASATVPPFPPMVWTAVMPANPGMQSLPAAPVICPPTWESRVFLCRADDVQVELVMLDPHIRTALRHDDNGRFAAQVRFPAAALRAHGHTTLRSTVGDGAALRLPGRWAARAHALRPIPGRLGFDRRR